MIWIREIWGKIKFAENAAPILVLDRYSSHVKSSVVDEISAKADIDFIPGGCTSIVQPLDVLINKLFKEHLRKSFETWAHTEGIQESNRTKIKKNIRALSPALLLTWIDQAWATIDSEIISKSFKVAGKRIISNSF